MMPTLKVTEQNFQETIKQGTVFLDFWASWCGPCRAFAPIFEHAAERHPGVVFGKVDTDAEPGLAQAFQVRAIPTLVVIRDGVLLASQAGMLPAGALDELVKKVEALDMDAVKREIETAEGAQKSAAKSAGGPSS